MGCGMCVCGCEWVVCVCGVRICVCRGCGRKRVVIQ